VAFCIVGICVVGFGMIVFFHLFEIADDFIHGLRIDFNTWRFNRRK
jgi:hypothetical protein